MKEDRAGQVRHPLEEFEIFGIHFKVADDLTRKPHLLPHVNVYYLGSDMLPVLRSHLTTLNINDTLRLISLLASRRALDPAQFEARLREVGLGPKEIFRDYQFALMVRLLLEGETDPRFPRREANPQDILKCCQLATNALPEADKLLGRAIRGDVGALLIRKAYEQFPDQEREEYLGRNLVIYRQIAPSVQGEYGFRLQKAYEDATGLTLDDTWFIGFAVYAHVMSQPGRYFTKSEFTESKDLPGLTTEKIDRFFELNSTEYTGYRAALDAGGTGKPGYESYNLNPLLRWPILRVDEERFVLPLPRLLLRRITEGLYYDLVRTDQGRFGNVLGLSFEIYVDRLLQDLPGVPLLIPQLTYGDRRTEVTCEWIAVDKDVAILIECKTRALSALAKVTGDRHRIRKDLSREHGVVDGIIKLKRVRDAIESRAPGLEQLHHVTKVMGLLVTLDDFYLANSPYIRGIVDEILARRAQKACPPEFQLTHVGGLEWLACLLSVPGTSIAQVLQFKVGDPTLGLRELDFKSFVPQAAERFIPGEKVNLLLPLHEKALDLFTGELADAFRVPPRT